MRTHAFLLAMLMLLLGSATAARSATSARSPSLMAFRDAAASRFGAPERKAVRAPSGTRGRRQQQQPVVASVSRRKSDAAAPSPPPQPEPEHDRGSRSNLNDVEVANMVGAVSCGGVMC